MHEQTPRQSSTATHDLGRNAPVSFCTFGWREQVAKNAWRCDEGNLGDVSFGLPGNLAATSAERNIRSSVFSIRAMNRAEPQFVVCVKNKQYGASLELRKLYQVVPDDSAARHKQLRVIDESGEDYLYPADYFVAVALPQAAGKAVLRASDLAPTK
jgi:hypothetical protein